MTIVVGVVIVTSALLLFMTLNKCVTGVTTIKREVGEFSVSTVNDLIVDVGVVDVSIESSDDVVGSLTMMEAYVIKSITDVMDVTGKVVMDISTDNGVVIMVGDDSIETLTESFTTGITVDSDDVMMVVVVLEDLISSSVVEVGVGRITAIVEPISYSLGTGDDI